MKYQVMPITCIKYSLIIFGLYFLQFFAGESLFAQSNAVKVLTYNIRYASAGKAPEDWDLRKSDVMKAIKTVYPDVFGLQEALHSQVLEMEHAFPAYSQIGVGRDDGKEAGEYSPVFFRKDKYKLIDSGTFWLSDTPSVAGSRGWDAACNRIVSWAKLTDIKTKRPFVVFCTHFDHIGQIARRNSAKLLLHAIDSIAVKNPAIVLGDFNSTPVSEPYLILIDIDNPKHLTDSEVVCKKVSTNESTFYGFQVGGQVGERIDYIFIKNCNQVIDYHVNKTNNGTYYPSDHLPVDATILIK